MVPLAAGGVGAAVNIATMRSVGRNAEVTFFVMTAPSAADA